MILQLLIMHHRREQSANAPLQLLQLPHGSLLASRLACVFIWFMIQPASNDGEWKFKLLVGNTQIYNPSSVEPTSTAKTKAAAAGVV